MEHINKSWKREERQTGLNQLRHEKTVAIKKILRKSWFKTFIYQFDTYTYLIGFELRLLSLDDNLFIQ